MARSKSGNTGSPRSIPNGQLSRGTPVEQSRNPKSNQSRRPDVVGRVPGEGGEALRSSGYAVTSDNYPDTLNGNNSIGKRGNPGSVPDGRKINTTYEAVTGVDVPSTTVTSSNRQRFSIDPGDVPQPNGDTTEGPKRPSFGVGTTGE